MTVGATLDYPDFISRHGFTAMVDGVKEDAVKVREVIAKSKEKEPLAIEECAMLIAIRSQPLVE